MRNLILLLLLFPFLSIGQVSDKISFQAVVYDNQNKLVVNRNVGVRMSIISGSVDGTIVYQETHMVTTSGTGLFTLQLGGGTPTIGTYGGINWGASSHFLKREFDINGGTNYQIMGIGEILSVPYAIYAKSAGDGFTHYIGEQYGGGVIFHLWKDKDGIERGLVVDLNELSTSQAWSNVTNVDIGETATTPFGYLNTQAIINQPGHTESAALLCWNSTNAGFTDWFLPSTNELYLLWTNLKPVNKALSEISGASKIKTGRDDHYYSSNEIYESGMWIFLFTGIGAGGTVKNAVFNTRAIREF